MKYIVEVHFANQKALIRRIVLGQVRHIGDQFGHFGFRAKRGETNFRVFQRGYLRMKWPSRRLARAYQSEVDAYWGTLTTTRRLRKK